MLAMRLQDQSGVNAADIGAVSIDAGQGQVFWDGILPDERALEEGTYNLTVRVRNFWGEESNPVTVQLECGAGEPATESLSLAEMQALARNEDAEAEMIAHDQPAPAAAIPAAAIPAAQTVPSAPASSVPVATSFWDMDPDAYDLKNPEHQQAIWDLMMQPITVLDVEQTEHIYPTTQPGIKRTPYETNTTGE